MRWSEGYISGHFLAGAKKVSRMVKAAILVCCKLLRTKRVVELAKKQPGVKEAFPVHGRWDVAIATDDLSLRQIADIGVNIYKADGVEIVETLVGFPED